ncbi:MAG: hypothetical protein HC915_17760 [Anaerolineae bacterium]|nr:hypothetical protein [Anaerolineae bacterium]
MFRRMMAATQLNSRVMLLLLFVVALGLMQVCCDFSEEIPLEEVHRSLAEVVVGAASAQFWLAQALLSLSAAAFRRAHWAGSAQVATFLHQAVYTVSPSHSPPQA